jgi:hypothetical protein
LHNKKSQRHCTFFCHACCTVLPYFYHIFCCFGFPFCCFGRQIPSYSNKRF